MCPGVWLLLLTTTDKLHLTLVYPFYTLEEPDPAGVSIFIVRLPFADPDPVGHMQPNIGRSHDTM